MRCIQYSLSVVVVVDDGDDDDKLKQNAPTHEYMHKSNNRLLTINELAVGAGTRVHASWRTATNTQCRRTATRTCWL